MSISRQTESDSNFPLVSSHQSLYSNPAAQYLASLGSDKSRRVVRDRLNDIATALDFENWESIDWSQADRQWVYVVRETYKERHSPSTINACVSALKSVARFAWDSRLISADAYHRIKETRQIRAKRVPKTRFIEGPELKTLIDKCLDDDRVQGSRDCAMLGLLFGAGLRRSEVVSLDVRDIDTQDGTVRIIGKGNKERITPLPARSLALLSHWLEMRSEQDGPIFTRIRKGGVITNARLTDQAVYFLVQKWVVMAGIPNFSPHDLRGSFISYLLDAGEDISTVAEMAGHASITTTARYDRRGEKRKKKAAAKIHF